MDKELALSNAARYIFVNLSDDEIRKIPTGDRNKLFSLVKAHINNLTLKLEDMNDLDISMLISLIKKYLLDIKQNKKFDELISFLEKYKDIKED